MKKEMIVLFRERKASLTRNSFFIVLKIFTPSGQISEKKLRKSYLKFFKSSEFFSENFTFESIKDLKRFVEILALDCKIDAVKYLDIFEHNKTLSKDSMVSEYEKFLEHLPTQNVSPQSESFLDRIFSF